MTACWVLALTGEIPTDAAEGTRSVSPVAELRALLR